MVLKALIIKKSQIILIINCVLLVFAVGLIAADKIYTECFSFSSDYPVYSVETSEKKICITFDAAWESDDTDRLIEILKKHNASATIFAVAQWAAENESAVVKFKNAGHEIENHSYNHRLYTDLSDVQICDDLAQSSETIAAVAGENPQFVRVPSGEYNKRVIKTIYSLGLYPVQWDVDSLDYTGIPTEEIVNNVLKKVKKGSIILFHNGVKNTPEALDIILSELGSQGYEFVKVKDLVYKDDFSFNSEGRQFYNQKG